MVNSKYLIDSSVPDFAKQYSSIDIIQKIDTNLSTNTHKEICNELTNVNCISLDKYEFYTRLIYKINNPEILDSFVVSEYSLSENSHIIFHKIGVIRNNLFINKLEDANIKIFNDENNSISGVINKNTKINLRLNDVHIGDYAVIEYSIVDLITDKNILKKDFPRHTFYLPHSYWYYLEYNFILINNTKNDIYYKKVFFEETEPDISGLLKEGNSFEFKKHNLSIDEVEIQPFIDFSSALNWQSISNKLSDVYSKYYLVNEEELSDSVFENIKKLGTLDEKIKYVIEYVQNNIKYIFDANEMDGHLPQEIFITEKTKTGDCKAKAIYLDYLLKRIGCDSNLVLVNYESDFLLDKFLPSPGIFNHVILKIKYNNKIYFIDPTISGSYGFLDSQYEPDFIYYLDILPNSVLSQRDTFADNVFFVEKDFKLKINKENYVIEASIILRKNVALIQRKLMSYNGMEYFKQNILSNLKTTLNISEIDKNDLKILDYLDNKEENTISYSYTCEIKNVNSKGNSVTFYDPDLLNVSILNYNNKYIPYVQNSFSIKEQIEIESYLSILKDKITDKVLSINNKYFKYNLKKNKKNNVLVCNIEYCPIRNVVIPSSDLKSLKDDYLKVSDSSYGVGVLIDNRSFILKYLRWIWIGLMVLAYIYNGRGFNHKIEEVNQVGKINTTNELNNNKKLDSPKKIDVSLVKFSDEKLQCLKSKDITFYEKENCPKCEELKQKIKNISNSIKIYTCKENEIIGDQKCNRNQGVFPFVHYVESATSSSTLSYGPYSDFSSADILFQAGCISFEEFMPYESDR